MDLPNFSDRLIYTVPAGTGASSELLANREWRVCKEKGGPRVILTSLNGEQVWDGPVFESPWSPDEPQGPSTGVHGFKNRYRREWTKKDWFYGRRTWAWGWVALSGLVEEFELGYRAERGAIRQLRLGPRTLAHFGSPNDVRGIIAELEDRYQCRVKLGYPEWHISRTMLPAVTNAPGSSGPRARAASDAVPATSTIGDQARTSGGTPPFGPDEPVDGFLTIAPGTIYLGKVRWWEYTSDPKRLYCKVCGVTILNFWMAINAHVRDNHRPDQF